jgi:hypothetical protein
LNNIKNMRTQSKNEIETDKQTNNKRENEEKREM